MSLDSIDRIREKRDSIRESIKNINYRDYKSLRYGSEEEYTFKGLIGGIEALLTDISTLTKYPSKFVKTSTYNERLDIQNYLSRIELYIDTPIHYITQFESLKALLRNYRIRDSSDRQVEFEAEIEEVRRVKLELQEILTDSKGLNEDVEKTYGDIQEKLQNFKDKFSEVEEELDDIITRRNELVRESEKQEKINNFLEEIKNRASENEESITNSMNESKANEKLITSFADKVLDREKRLDALELNTENNNKELQEYKEERESILKEANDLIKSSKEALNYTSAQGISASFQNQYENSNNKLIFGGWIFGAIICLLGTIALGIWILHELSDTDSIGLLIGRISLLPLPIIGAIFCANQYTKQKNIIEDYAYKMVLSKAMVGFSEQLKKYQTNGDEEYVHYIKTALEEIHRDPLRKRNSKKSKEIKESSLNDIVDIAGKIVNITKLNQ